MENKTKSACVFFSSPRRNGYTAQLLKIFMSHAHGYKFNIVDCYKRNVSPCIDCRYCRNHPSCIFNDMKDIDEYLRKVDLLIFASPVYNFSFPAPIKAILDRMQRYFSARFYMNIKPPIIKRKKAVLLASCGSKGTQGVQIMEIQLKKIFTIINCEFIGTILIENSDNLSSIPDYMETKVKEIINSL